MASKAKVEKFTLINKALIKGQQGHSRTGACTAKGRCTCPTIPRPKLNFKKAKKSKTLKGVS